MDQRKKIRVLMTVQDWHTTMQCVEYWVEQEEQLSKGRRTDSHELALGLRDKLATTIRKYQNKQQEKNIIISGEELVFMCNAIGDKARWGMGDRQLLAPIATHLEKTLAQRFGAHVWVNTIACHVGVWGKETIAR